MPLDIPTPINPGDDLWHDPDLVAAVEAGRLDLFLLAYRGTRRARMSQDRVARLLGCRQSTVSRLESGKGPASPTECARRVDEVLTGLGVPTDLRRRWGG